MLNTGAPIGTVTVSASVTSWKVTSTPASVGPYRLCRRAPVSSRSRCAVTAGRPSPEAKTLRRPVHSAARGSTTNSDIIEGTKCAVVMCSSMISCAR
ncbi:Uncharacterised protein [Mycobacteroides abscessus subsp. abscessus]|nr:Uncharacterised protein [Mycobacteroides abscessus subsp. abscessus]